jgi:hypothetical protein
MGGDRCSNTDETCEQDAWEVWLALTTACVCCCMCSAVAFAKIACSCGCYLPAVGCALLVEPITWGNGPCVAVVAGAETQIVGAVLCCAVRTSSISGWRTAASTMSLEPTLGLPISKPTCRSRAVHTTAVDEMKVRTGRIFNSYSDPASIHSRPLGICCRCQLHTCC